MRKTASYFYIVVQDDNEDRQAQRELVSTLLQTQETLDEKMKHSELQLFSNAKPITGEELEQYEFYLIPFIFFVLHLLEPAKTLGVAIRYSNCIVCSSSNVIVSSFF